MRGFRRFWGTDNRVQKWPWGKPWGKMRSERGRFGPCAGPPVHLRSPATNANKRPRRRWNAQGPAPKNQPSMRERRYPSQLRLTPRAAVLGALTERGAHGPITNQAHPRPAGGDLPGGSHSPGWSAGRHWTKRRFA
jgi:hypothetical protein